MKAVCICLLKDKLQVLLKYGTKIGKWDVTGVYHEDIDDVGERKNEKL